MPARWEFDTNPAEIIEDDDLFVDDYVVATFDGHWRATYASGDTVQKTVVCISGTNCWHNCELYATVRLVNRHTCVLVMQSEDVKGHLSDDASKIEWDDGDCWHRVVDKPKARDQGKLEKDEDRIVGSGNAEQQQIGQVSNEAPEKAYQPRQLASAEDAAAALLRREAKALQDVLDDGVPVDSHVDPAAIWREMRWDPAWRGPPPETPLLVAAALLQWPEGVEICVRYGADVNGTYRGPLRCVDGSTCCDESGSSVLRVAVSARGPSQCTICTHILRGKVRCKTFKLVKKKARGEMDFVTAGFFDKFEGPFLDS